ncbi:hypothetical protein ACT7C3_09855 [Bacillus pacificus]
MKKCEKMNYEVNVNGKSSEEVAKQFLQKRTYFVKFTRNIQIYMYEMTVHYKMNGFFVHTYTFFKKVFHFSSFSFRISNVFLKNIREASIREKGDFNS